MNGFLLLIPFFLVRFLLLNLLNPKAVQRAAYFAPLEGNERIAYYIYQISNIAIFVYLFFVTVELDGSWQFYSGFVCYIVGLCLCIITVVHFSYPDGSGLNTNGIYKVSRNPMYVAYFIFFIGSTLLTQSLILLVMIAVFQISAHWIIISEERWCVNHFGTDYLDYMKKVRRYI